MIKVKIGKILNEPIFKEKFINSCNFSEEGE